MIYQFPMIYSVLSRSFNLRNPIDALILRYATHAATYGLTEVTTDTTDTTFRN